MQKTKTGYFFSRFKRLGLFLVATLLAVQTVLPLAAPQSTAALEQFDDLTTNSRTYLFELSYAMYYCYQYSRLHTGPDERGIGGGNIFINGGAGGVMISDPGLRNDLGMASDSKYAQCDNDSNNGLSKLFFTTIEISPLDFVCDIGYTREETSCKVQSDIGHLSFPFSGKDRAARFANKLKDVAGLDIVNPDGDVLYLSARNALEMSCLGGEATKIQYDETGTGSRYAVRSINNEGSIYTNYFGAKEGGRDYTLNYQALLNRLAKNCGDLEQLVNSRVYSYYGYLFNKAKQECVDKYNYAIDAQAVGCALGAMTRGGSCSNLQSLASKGENFVLSFAGIQVLDIPASNISQAADKCESGSALVVDINDIEVEGVVGGEVAQSCGSWWNAIGWIMCPVIEGLAGFVDTVYKWIENILQINPLTVSGTGTNDESAVYKVWIALRDIANALLVIAFIIIIFSQLTGLFVTNYGIKKMLPRIILVAIAINLSFFVMMLAVDLVNLIGAGLYDLLVTTADKGVQTVDFNGVLNAIAPSATLGLGIALLAGEGLASLFWLALPILVGAALAVVAAIVTLFVRNALVIVLALLSPIAFAAFLLPNTQSLFDRWRKLFVNMLVLYPMAALLFGGAQLAGSVLTVADPDEGVLNNLFGYFIMVAPLFMLPWLARQGGPALAKVNDKFGQWAKAAQKGTSGITSGLRDDAREKVRANRRTFLGRRIPTVPDSDRRRQIKDEIAAGRRSGESTADWDRRRASLLEDHRNARRPARRTVASRIDAMRRNREADTELSKATAEENWRGQGTNIEAGSSRTARRTNEILTGQERVGLQKSATEAKRKELLSQRINTAGTAESVAFGQKRGSEVLNIKHEKGAEARFQDSINSSSGRPDGLFEAIQDTKMSEKRINVAGKEQEGEFQVRLASGTPETTELLNREVAADVRTERGQQEIKAHEADQRANNEALRPDLDATSDAKDTEEKWKTAAGARLDQRALDTPEVFQTRAETAQYKTAQERAQGQSSQRLKEIATNEGRENLRAQTFARLREQAIRERRQGQQEEIEERLRNQGLGADEIARHPDMLDFNAMVEDEVNGPNTDTGLEQDINNSEEMAEFNQLAATGATTQEEEDRKTAATTATRFATDQAALEYAESAQENDGNNPLAEAAAGATGSREGVQAAAVDVVDQAEEKEVNTAAKLLKTRDYNQPAHRAIANDPNEPTPTRLAAIRQIVQSEDLMGVDQLLEASHGWGDSPDARAMRRFLRSELQSKKPGYVSALVLAQLTDGDHGRPIDLASAQINQINRGQYSPEVLATANPDELVIMTDRLRREAGLQDDEQPRPVIGPAPPPGSPRRRAWDANVALDRLQRTSNELLNGQTPAMEQLRARMQKTQGIVGRIANGNGPESDDIKALNRALGNPRDQ